MVSVGQVYGKGLAGQFSLGVSMQWQSVSSWIWGGGEKRELEQLGASRQLSPHEHSVALFGRLELSHIISPKVPRLLVQLQHECFRALARS